MEIAVEFQGVREIAAAMRELPRRLDSNLLNGGLIIGARLVRDEAQLLAPELSGNDERWTRGALRRAIAATRVKPSDGFAAEVIVRVRKISRRQLAKFKRRQAARKSSGKSYRRIDPRDAFYWTFIEFGTAKMAASPFLRPAFESRKEQAVKASLAYFEQRVQLEIEKLGRTFNTY